MLTTTIKTFETMTLSEMIHLKNNYLVQKYKDEISKLMIDKFSKEVVQTLYGAPIIDIVEEIEEKANENRSESLFPGQNIIVYPGIKEVRARNEKGYTCDFSEAKISKGSLYINYRPMLKNINNGDTYVLNKTIKTETAYYDDLPKNIIELEEFNDRIINYEYYEDGYIHYDHLFEQIGRLQFKKLSRRKKYENRNNK